MTSPIKKPTGTGKVGRPVKEIDLKLVTALAEIACTDEEISSIVGVSLETFKRRKRDEDFAEMLAGARAKGRGSLRRMQWVAAKNGSVPMMIFLGKNLLGQRDKFDDANGSDGKAETRYVVELPAEVPAQNWQSAFGAKTTGTED